MKRLNYFIAIIFTALTFSACETFIADNINLDPNNPSSVSLNAILPSIQIRHMDVFMEVKLRELILCFLSKQRVLQDNGLLLTTILVCNL